MADQERVRVLTNKVPRETLRPGDHIYHWIAKIISHHGIYIGGGKVIHYVRGDSKSLVSSTSSSYRNVPTTGGVIESSLDEFLDGRRKPYLYAYDVTNDFFQIKRGGTCTIIPSDSAELVIWRAQYLLTHGFGQYDLFDNNCEAFCLYCKTALVDPNTGRPGGSGQVEANAAAAMTSPIGIFNPPAWMSMCMSVRLSKEIEKRDTWIKVEVDRFVANK